MLAIMNVLVKAYIKRFDKELNQIRFAASRIQEKELDYILNCFLPYRLNNGLSKSDKPRASFGLLLLTDYQDYAASIEELKSDLKEKRVEYYAQSSGTSGMVKKLIPTPESYVKRNHLRGSWYILNTLYNNVEDMNVFTCKNLLIGGAIYSRHDNYLIGDVSGIMLNRIPSFFRPFYVPSIKVATMPIWEEKLRKTVTAASNTSEVSLLGGVPTWVIAVVKEVMKNNQADDLTQIWPNLKAYIHGGVSIAPYKKQFQAIIKDPSFQYIEVYNATEGFFAFQDNPNEEGMLLMLQSGIYYEFVEKSLFKGKDTAIENILPLSEVEKGPSYVMIISTMTGLLRYIQGDVVSFTHIAPYKIKVVGRITEYINAFGEDLLLNQAEEALLKTADYHNVIINHYSVGPRYISINEKGCHEWYIEFNKSLPDLDLFASTLDKELCIINSNYRQKRSGELALECLKVFSLRENAFKEYLKENRKLGAQSKVLKLSNNRDIINKLNKYVIN